MTLGCILRHAQQGFREFIHHSLSQQAIQQRKAINSQTFQEEIEYELDLAMNATVPGNPYTEAFGTYNIINILQSEPQSSLEDLTEEPESKKRHYCRYFSYKKKRMTK